MSRVATPTRVTAALAAVLLAILCLGAKVSRIQPPEPAPPLLRVNGGRVAVIVGGSVEIALELVEARERVRFLKERGADAGGDPFAPDPLGRYKFTTFRLDLKNGSSSEVSLHPASMRAVADATPYFPLEYTAAYEHFVSRRRFDPPLFESISRGAFFENIVVPPGGTASGLIAFRNLPERFKKFQILGANVMIGTEGRSFLIPYRVVQEKVPKK
jgi:hypothetical protein